MNNAARRREDVRRRDDLNGLDYVEIDQHNSTRLYVYLLGKLTAELADALQPANFRIEGGARIRSIRVTNVHSVQQNDPERDDILVVDVNRRGDFSPFHLSVVETDQDGWPTGKPHPAFDQRFASIPLNFRADCPADLDCKTEPDCPPEVFEEPEIDYLAKDYASFRRLILDRLAVIMPEWTERHVPDLGITLVELLAYVGDHLSYYQDAVATEAYLDTARQRQSVRRHVRLVDYRLHEGCNARAWVVVEVSDDIELDAQRDYFITGFENDSPPTVDSRGFLPEMLRDKGGFLVYEPLVAQQAIHLWQAHNEIMFYTWGEREVCLPRGTTHATLRDEYVEDAEPDATQPET
ncbi:MAG: putative baseplate assembly protein, partial [Chloroflexi bacterium]|nr:putative baseplate assembly protein [Chloroflexota bacterium]